MLPEIFLVSGSARSGKGVVTTAIINQLGAKELSFAGPLKKYACRYFSVMPHEVFSSQEELERSLPEWSRSEKNFGKTPQSRMILQSLGACFRHEVDENYWANLGGAAAELSLHIYPTIPIVFSDWRYPNEEEAIRSTGYHVATIRVIRPDRPAIEAGETHESETSLSDTGSYDKVFHNVGTKEALEEGVYSWLEALASGIG